MLLQLSIRDYAVARALDMDFQRGMTAITGETGAGKSVLLDALGLVLGDRADADAIASGADRADISALFDLQAQPEALLWLEEQGIAVDEEQCLLRRSLLREGRSRAWINGQPATLQQLRELGDRLINIHSQHEHQSLLRKETHRQLLDAFGQHDAALHGVALRWREWRDLQQQIDALQGSRDDISARLQLLQYQVDELDRIGPTSGEVEALETEHKQLANAGQLIESCEQLLQLCRDGEHFNIQHTLTQAQQHLARSPLQEAMPQLAELLGSALIQIDEASHDLDRYRDTINIDPERLVEVEKRLDALHSLARKHKIQARDLPTLHTKLSDELQTLLYRDNRIADLQQHQLAVQAHYLRDADALTKLRKKTATKLTRAVNEQLALLKMAHCRFAVDMVPRIDQHPHEHGAEQLEFLISTQPDSPPRALARVASGGELSRISLAIQVVTAHTSHVPTLVFDEVDVGIGGGTAVVVGRLLRELGEKGQVLCVTHQAQVAAQAHQHLLAIKTLTGKRMETRLQCLDKAARIEEVARMLGGESASAQSRAHAEEMLSA